VAGRGIQHIDLAVADVDRSLAFYGELLGPLGLTEYDRALSPRASAGAGGR
jgi:catechol 2,3-dioxygenase-like lactoylglutathione lyase family enzyme